MKLNCWMIPLLCIAVLSGCSMVKGKSSTGTSVKAWERGDLARKEMSWDVDLMESSLKNHVHFSKEGSNGGGDAAGGGCGCN